ncbi:MAG: hypothetical protein EOO93_17085 [Pedobacter sp.]|nr:MAG: hypothetical protein EOO93_17085 [Pedobacter sp.]
MLSNYFFGLFHPRWDSGLSLTILNSCITYLPALIVTLVFTKRTNLVSRLPKPIPGVQYLKFGLGIIVLTYAIFALTILSPGGGLTFGVAMFLAPFGIVAQILILIGVVKAFLAAKPELN